MYKTVFFAYIVLSLLSCKRGLYIDDEIVLNEPDSTITINDICFQIEKQSPIAQYVHENHIVYDFGKDAFSQIEITVNSTGADSLVVLYGECIKDSIVDMQPGDTRRYGRISIPLLEGSHTYRPIIKRIPYADDKEAIKMPKEIGEVTPMRYLQIEKDDKISRLSVCRYVVTCHFNDNASSFHSDNETLNKIWDFCKYSIKATSFCGYYVDGDRERRPYEADALINQLGHLGVDSYFDISRRTIRYLLDNPTWPSEWIMQTIMLAWNDYLFSGNKEILQENYQLLQKHALFALVDHSTGLVSTKKGQTTAFLTSLNLKSEIRDIVDWPHSDDEEFQGGEYKGEDDGYVYTEYNTVVNAYHYKAVCLLANIAEALGLEKDAYMYSNHAKSFKNIFNDNFFNSQKGVYIDGLGTSHSSLHANMFPLAFDLVPDEYVDSVADYIISRGMACSVYGAQFLLEALYKAKRGNTALNYLVSTSERSWVNMMREGATISMEAWGNKFKPNQDWNHAWGAAPANIVPFKLVGYYPITPGGEIIEIYPQIGSLSYVNATIPSLFGSIKVDITQSGLKANLPDGVKAKIKMLFPTKMGITNVFINGNKLSKYHLEKDVVVFDELQKGSFSIQLQ